jgi:membrane-associated phospholipid phosphatase
MNMITYFGTRLFTQNLVHYDLSCVIDDKIPFVSSMIWIYILSYVEWIIGFIVIGRESRRVCYEVLMGEQIAKFICLILFITVPTTIARPEITGGSLSEWMTNVIYTIDSPDNLFPSVHCLESWVCFRGALRCKKVGKGYQSIMFLAAIAVFASTVMVKQHVVVDIVAAIIVVEVGLVLSKKFNIYKMVQKRNHDKGVI